MRFALVALLALLLPAAAISADVPSNDPAAASEQWLRLLDQKDYGASWREASPEFKKRLSEDMWTDAVAKVRGPLGPVTVRKVANVTNTKSLPGLPDGDYAVVQFQTAFANKANAVETVTLIGGADGARVGGYFIK